MPYGPRVIYPDRFHPSSHHHELEDLKALYKTKLWLGFWISFEVASDPTCPNGSCRHFSSGYIAGPLASLLKTMDMFPIKLHSHLSLHTRLEKLFLILVKIFPLYIYGQDNMVYIPIFSHLWGLGKFTEDFCVLCVSKLIQNTWKSDYLLIWNEWWMGVVKGKYLKMLRS